jgi:hypothetical protein
MADDRKPPGFWGRVRAPLWVKIVVPVVVLLGVIVVASSGTEDITYTTTGRQIQVPDVKAKSVAEGRVAITAAGLNVYVRRGANEEPAGTVFLQLPPGGTKVSDNASVTLYVSRSGEWADTPRICLHAVHAVAERLGDASEALRYLKADREAREGGGDTAIIDGHMTSRFISGQVG